MSDEHVTSHEPDALDAWLKEQVESGALVIIPRKPWKL